MPVLLCRKKAERPFRHDKLNINLWSEQELCYVICNYPLLCLGSFAGETLFSWIEKDLQRKDLADRLRANKKAGESPENQLLLILQECNYYNVNEVRDFSRQIQELKRRSPFELIYMEGLILYRAGKFRMACDKMEEAIRLLDQEFRKTREEKLMDELLRKKADIYCDMAVIRLRMFDEPKALELLVSSQTCFANERAERMRYLINGAGDLSDARKKELDKEKQEAVEMARESKPYQEAREMLDKDSARAFKEAGEMVRNWKKAYRGML